LNELKTNIESSISCGLIKDKNCPIYLIKVQTDTSGDKFGEIYGSIELDRAHLRSKHVGDDWEHGRIRGQQKYSRDRSVIRFNTLGTIQFS